MGKEDQGAKAQGRKAPAYEINMGIIRGVVWENAGKKGVWYSINVTRRYRDGAGEVKYATSFGQHDALIAAEVLRACYVWIATKVGPVAVEEDGSSTASE